MRDQFVTHILSYIVLLPLLLSIFISGLLPWETCVWFFFLLILEHLTQETHRLFTVISRPIAANMVLFFKSGLWTFLAIGCLVVFPTMRTLTTVWAMWAIGAAIGLMFSVIGLRDHLWSSFREPAVDWAWIRSGVLISLPFLTSTLALRGVETIDRFVLKLWTSNADVGVYTFYSSISTATQVFIYSGVLMHLYPKILSAYQNKDFDQYNKNMRSLAVRTLAAVILISLCTLFGIEIALHIIGKPIYRENIQAFWILLASSGIVSFTYVPHYALYVRKADRHILASSVFAFLVAVVLNCALVRNLGMVGAALSTLGAMLALGAFKTLFWYRLRVLEAQPLAVPSQGSKEHP